MKKRNITKTIKELAKGYPVIVITGPRQSGKTTLAQMLFPKKTYVNFENPDVYELVKSDARSFLEKHKDGAIFDEVQRCPEIFSYLQEIVDNAKKPNMYILTGSQQFNLLAGITQSLAGRAALVELLPFTINECFTKENESLTSKSIDDIIFTGLYPPIHDNKLKPQLWYANYVRTYIERDVRQILNIKDLSEFQRFIRLCAGRSGQIINLSEVASDCSITHNTAKSWISILEASYLVFRLQPHYNNFNKRLIKAPKLYFYDTGLACYLLSIDSAKQLNTHSHRGALFENLIISEMVKSRFNSGLPSNLFFWRDRSGNEIDILIDKGEKLVPVEIKSGKTLNSDFFKGLLKWQKLSGNLCGEPILIYGGDETLTHKGIKVHSWRVIADLMD